MADAAGRPLALVNRPTTAATTGQAQFAARVQEVLQEHGDIASEQCWQEFARLIAHEWVTLSQDQPPVSTWGMLSKCTETIIRLRRAAQGSQRASGDDALEEFRRMMRDVAGADDEA